MENKEKTVCDYGANPSKQAWDCAREEQCDDCFLVDHLKECSGCDQYDHPLSEEVKQEVEKVRQIHANYPKLNVSCFCGEPGEFGDEIRYCPVHNANVA